MARGRPWTSSQRTLPRLRIGAERAHVRPASSVRNTAVTGRPPDRVTASHAWLASGASRTASVSVGVSSGLADAGVTSVQLRPPLVLRASASMALSAAPGF